MPYTLIKDETTGEETYQYSPVETPQEEVTPPINQAPPPESEEVDEVIDGGEIAPDAEGTESPSLRDRIREVTGIEAAEGAYEDYLSRPGALPSGLRLTENALREIVQETSDLITSKVTGKDTTAEEPDFPLFFGLGGPPLERIPIPEELEETWRGPAEHLTQGIVQAGVGYLLLRRPVGAVTGAIGGAAGAIPGVSKGINLAKGLKTGLTAKTTQAISQIKNPLARRSVALGAGAAQSLASNIAGKGALTGAAVDYTVFEPHDPRLTDLIDQFEVTIAGTTIEAPVVEYLRSDINDKGADGRLKNALEGSLIGGAAGTAFHAIRVHRAAVLLREFDNSVFTGKGKKAVSERLAKRQSLLEALQSDLDDLEEAASFEADKADISDEIETAITRSEGIEKAIDPEVLPPIETGPTKPKKISEVLRENLRALAQSDARQLRALDAELKGFSQAMDDIESPKPKEAALPQPVDEIKAIETELEGLKKPIKGDRSKEAKRYRSLRRKLVKLQKEQKNIAKANEEFPPRIVAEETYTEPTDAEFQEWFNNPPEKYRQLFKEIKESRKKTEQTIKRSDEAFKKLDQSIKQLEEFADDMGSESKAMYEELGDVDKQKVDLELNLKGLKTIRQQILEEPQLPEAPKAPPVGEDLPLEVRERYEAELRQYNSDMDKWEAQQRQQTEAGDGADGGGTTGGGNNILPPPPPEPPTGVKPPSPDDSWWQQLVNQINSNREAIQKGDMSWDDILINNVLKVKSPTGKRIYVPISRSADEARRGFSDLIDRVEATGVFETSYEEIETETLKKLQELGYNPERVLGALQKLSGPLSKYKQNLATLRIGLLYSDHANLQAGIAADRWLNRAADPTLNQKQLAAEVMTAANEARRANTAVEKITRPLGQLLKSMQMPRPQPGTVPFGAPPIELDIRQGIVEGLGKDPGPISKTIGKRISKELQEAVNSGDYSSPKVQAELNALATALSQNAKTPNMSPGFWKKFNNGSMVGVRGLVMYRAAQLLSSGATLFRTSFGNTLRAVQLPLTQALGAAVERDFMGVSESAQIYAQYIHNWQNALRLGIESSKVGRALYDMDRTSLDYFDRLVAKDKARRLDASESGIKGEGEWNLNTMPWVNIQDKTTWAWAQRKLWQGANLATRAQVTVDTAYKVLVGQSFEYARNLREGIEAARTQGIDVTTRDGQEWVRKYAEEAVEQQLRDVVIDGKTILDAVMEGEYAQKAMRWATFTDDIWATMEKRTLKRGTEIGVDKGLQGDELKKFAEEWIQIEPDVPLPSRAFSVVPTVWRHLMDLHPAFGILQPFNRTPGDIIKSAARMTPGAHLAVDTWWRDINSMDRMTRQRALGDVALGATSWGLLTIAITSANVQVTGAGPSNPAARQKWYGREKKIPYAIRLKQGEDEKGNTIWGDWMQYGTLEPFATILGAIADYVEVGNKIPDEVRDQLGSALTMDLVARVASGQLSKTYYQGFQEFHDAILGMSEAEVGPNRRNPLVRWIQRINASLIPASAALRAGRRIQDPTVRAVPSSETGNFVLDFFREQFNEIANGIPGKSEHLLPKLDWVTGEPMYLTGIYGDQYIPFDNPWIAHVFSFFNPASAFGRKSSDNDPVSLEMARLHGRGASFMGPSKSDFTHMGGPDNRMNDEEFHAWTELIATIKHPETGLTMHQSLLSLIETEWYQSLAIERISNANTQTRTAALNQVINDYRRIARSAFTATIPGTNEAFMPIAARIIDNIQKATNHNEKVKFQLEHGHQMGLPPENTLNTDLVPR